jgi:hypothetical protein
VTNLNTKGAIMFDLLSQIPGSFPDLTSIGAAGLMGAMWLWERNTSRTREEQLNAYHQRILSDRIQLDALVEIVQQNTQAMTRRSTVIEQNTKEAA